MENYEEGREGKIYAEIALTVRNMFGQAKVSRFAAVIKSIEPDGTCVFATPGPQLMTKLTGPRVLKKMLGFKSL